MEYITKVLGLKVTRSKWEEETILPYYLINEYQFELVTIDGIPCLVLKPIGELETINAVKKHVKRIAEIVSYPIIFEMDSIPRQRKQSFIEAKIPFIVPEKQLYLPFMGTLLTEKCDGESAILVRDRLQPSAQMLLFSFLLGKGKPMQMSKTATQLRFSSMTISRAANQLVEVGLLKKEITGNQKLLISELSPKDLYTKAEPYLFSPVKKTIYIYKEQKYIEMFHAGLTALSKRSMLNPPTVEVLGCTFPEKEFPQRSSRLIDVEKQCALQLWRYDPRLISQTEEADVFSLAVSLRDDEDERVELCIEEMLGKVW